MDIRREGKGRDAGPITAPGVDKVFGGERGDGFGAANDGLKKLV